MLSCVKLEASSKMCQVKVLCLLDNIAIPETIVFQAWMEKFELAKKVRQKQQDEIAFKRSNTMSRR
jgi:hypothetical protein